MAKLSYDVVIIGGGPGGYVAAIKAAQLGLKTACVDKRSTLGGTCLNVGCIPSKALLNSSEKYTEIAHLEKFGIEVKGAGFDLMKMMVHKDRVVQDLTKGIDYLLKKNKVGRFQGTATIVKPGVVEVKILQTAIVQSDKVKSEPNDTTKTLDTKNIIIATGSVSTDIPGIPIDEKTIVSSTGALSLREVPKKMVVIGGGYIGLEMASVWARLGSEVTVVEFADMIVPMMDHEVAKSLRKSLEKQGMKFMLGTKVVKVTKNKKGATLELANAKDDQKLSDIEADVVLVSVGRKPYTQGLGLENVNITPNARGMIEVDRHYQTTAPGIYAIGDVIPGPMLAHKAEEEGVAVAESLAGQSGHVNYGAIPGVIYTMPEAAAVGKTEEDLKNDGIEYNVGKFSFSANSRAKATNQTEGFVKILADKKTDEILGAHIISADAGTLISELVLAMEYKASSEDIARTCHAHPTTNEAVKEAALATFFKAIHS